MTSAPSPTVSEETRRLWLELLALVELDQIYAQIRQQEETDEAA